MNRRKSKAVFKEAQNYIPGGVNSPVRAFKSVGMDPIFVDYAKGSKLYDIDGNEYTDYICSWGPLIFGHSHEELLEGIEDIFKKGTSYGIPTAIEVDIAKEITEIYPAMDQIRMVNSGTEATMSAIRVARAYTDRDKIIKFEGCYHGHSDGLLVEAGSGAITFGEPNSPGVPSGTTKDTIVCKYNDLASVEKAFEKFDDIAAIILEPVAGNMGVVPGKPDFLKGLRKITKKNNALLIFDEVITGFRLSLGGAQEYFNIEPDLTCLGKIIGGGLPVGAYGGKKEIMAMVSPVGNVYQAGTLSGNPLAMHMGLKTIRKLNENKKEVYEHLKNLGERLEKGMQKNIDALGIKARVNRIEGMVCFFFVDETINNFDEVKNADTVMYSKYFKGMLDRGVLMPPSQFEGLFLSAVHTFEELDETLKKHYDVLREII
jgi:glutamate-1-semialdehyde 2,1-aminomutase